MAGSRETTLDPVFAAMQHFKRRKYEQCISACSDLLATNPYDQAVWYLKTRALTMLNWVCDAAA